MSISLRSARSFNASTSTDEGTASLDSSTYVWTVGSEAVRTGRIQTHGFRTPGVHSVSLTVTDAAGSSATAQQNVTVTAIARPVVSAVTFMPATPVVGQSTACSAAFTVAPNHRITGFVWRWGDGTTTTTTDASTTHTFAAEGTYVVTVTATDDVGQSASAGTSVTVGGGAVANFSFSPRTPVAGDTVHFNGSPSNALGGATIVEWTWDFGDGTTETKSEPTTSHPYPTARTFRVRLTVKDSAGRTGTTTQDVPVTEPDDP